ncbi:MAG: hypothetical protein BWX51_01381 [Bacteroidetes bacterium ADurb.Bin012]|nr:MAG: hypothetical protein BWX51_01381 [Bacteroidetes bacterium ADurb.Bin012]
MKNFRNVVCMIFLIPLCNSLPLIAQDLIVTIDNDSINCKITKIKPDFIYFTFKYKNEIRNTLLPKSQVKYHQSNYFATSEIPQDKIKIIRDFPRFKLAAEGGWSTRTAKIADDVPPDFKNYMKDLKTGFHFGMDAYYYFIENIGIGIKCNRYHSKNVLKNVYIQYANGSMEFGNMSDNIKIYFIGPFVSLRMLNKNKNNNFYMNWGIGYTQYNDEAVFVYEFSTKGNNIGLFADWGYEIGLSKNFSLGFQLSIIASTLTKYKLITDFHTETVKLDKENYENLSHLNLSIGLRFYK